MTRTTFLSLFALALLALPVVAGAAEAPAFKIIVHPRNPHATLKREKVASLFLKKSTAWDDGTTARPVDLGEESATRRAFTQDVLKKSVAAVKAYWQQRIFSGRELPPPEKATDEEVLAFVRANESAIGYVSAQAPVEGVKLVTLAE